MVTHKNKNWLQCLLFCSTKLMRAHSQRMHFRSICKLKQSLETILSRSLTKLEPLLPFTELCKKSDTSAPTWAKINYFSQIRDISTLQKTTKLFSNSLKTFNAQTRNKHSHKHIKQRQQAMKFIIKALLIMFTLIKVTVNSTARTKRQTTFRFVFLD